jgi:hypothetical protein
LTWRKSSCRDGGDCVQVAKLHGNALFVDPNAPRRTIFCYTPQEWDVFLTGVVGLVLLRLYRLEPVGEGERVTLVASGRNPVAASCQVPCHLSRFDLRRSTHAAASTASPGGGEIICVTALSVENPMDLASNAITALVTLLAVLLGGWLTVRNQDRLWRHDHARQWREIRLATYRDFLTAYREYIAFTLEPTAKITAVPHPRHPGEMMPFFDQAGRPYKEKFEATLTAARLVSELPQTMEAITDLVRQARQVAALRAIYEPGETPADDFAELWDAERAFVGCARLELGLAIIPHRTRRPDESADSASLPDQAQAST